MKATVYVEENISRRVEVDIPINADVEKYIEDYIMGFIDDSYDWDANDIVEDNTVIVGYDLHKEG
jgi:hypothetical protein